MKYCNLTASRIWLRCCQVQFHSKLLHVGLQPKNVVGSPAPCLCRHVVNRDVLQRPGIALGWRTAEVLPRRAKKRTSPRHHESCRGWTCCGSDGPLQPHGIPKQRARSISRGILSAGEYTQNGMGETRVNEMRLVTRDKNWDEM